MKVICDRGALVESLNLVGAVVPSRTPKPVITCVKLVADDAGLTLTATDLEISIKVTTARVEVQQPGEVLIPAEKFGAIVRESFDPTLTIHSEPDGVTIRGQDAKFKVLSFPVADFPAIPAFSGDGDFTIPANDLAPLINQTLYATARENSRYAINGVLLEREHNKLTLVATDGHRLAMSKGDCKGAKGDARSAIIPTKALNMLLKLLGDSETPVKAKIADNQVHFATDAAQLSSNLVEGNFPPYKDVIPRDGDKKATLNTDQLASGFRRAQLLTNEESKGVKMAFAKSGLILSSRAAEMGEAEIKIELPAYEGEPIEIGFNPAYVLDALKVVNTDQITLDLRAPNKPGVIRTGPNFLYVIMPVNLQ